MLGQFLLLMLLATQEAMFEIHFARELYSLIMNYIFGDSLPPYMSWRGQWESNLPLWRPDEMSYGAMVTSCSTVAEKIIGLWRFTKRPASRRTRQWLVYIGIMKETLAKRNGGNRPTHCFAELSILAPKKETVLLLVDNESRYTPKVQRLEPENHDDGNSKFEIPPKIQDIRIWKSQGWTKQFFNFLGGTSFFFISKSQGRTFHWSEAFGFLEMAKLNGCRWDPSNLEKSFFSGLGHGSRMIAVSPYF